MEYVVVRAACPTWLNTQLPAEVAKLIRFDPPAARGMRDMNRGIAFFARGPSVARVVNAVEAQDVHWGESNHQRHLGFARVSEKGLFSLPALVQRHLGLQSEPRGPSGIRATDDTILWFTPAPEYYEFRGVEWRQRTWTGPSGGGYAHVYVTKSILPLDRHLEPLARLDEEIEEHEWRPRLEALKRVAR
jgi:hypothetical protein